MRRPVLVDTSALVALALPTDGKHAAALNILAGLKSRRTPLLATTDIFDETVTLLRRWGGYARAVETGELLRASRLLDIVSVDNQDRDEAWRLFQEHKTPDLSFTDCTSAAIMERLELEEVFAFDSDFRGFGFAQVPDPE